MIPKLTDGAVSGLPLLQGRAELLEEIVATPVLDDRPARADSARRATRWLVPVAAAAVVAACAAGAAWWAEPGSGGSRPGGVVSQPSDPVAESRDLLVLDADGWQVDSAYTQPGAGVFSYRHGDAELTIWWDDNRPPDCFEEGGCPVGMERRREPVRVLGQPAMTWSYAADEHHTSLVKAEGERDFSFAARGLDAAAYRELLGHLRWVDAAGFEAAMPAWFLADDEREAAIAEILAEIGEVADPVLPDGVARSRITSEMTERYRLGTDVAGVVACAWLDEYVDAARAGADGRAQRAADVLAGSRTWPVLQEMEERGDHPKIWSFADDIADGRMPKDYVPALACGR
jgi:hypothetical protein